MRVGADGAIAEQRYWDVLGRRGRLGGVSEDEIAERVLAELRTAVRLRKVSDVPVGVFLSGGIDSSTNAALFSEGETAPGQDVLDRLRRRLSRATATSSPYARQMAARVGADHHELR